MNIQMERHRLDRAGCAGCRCRGESSPRDRESASPKADRVRDGAVLVAPFLGALAVVGGLLSKRALVVLAGAGFAAAAVFLVVQVSLGISNTLGGDGSTVGMFLAFAIGLLPVGLALV